MRWRKIATRALLLVSLIIVVLAVLIRTGPVQRLLLQSIEVAAERLGFPFTAEQARFRPLDLAASISGLKYEKDGVSVRIATLEIDVPWNFYGKDGVKINFVEANGVQVRITSSESIVPQASGVTTREYPRIDIGRLTVKNGSFFYENRSTRLNVPLFSIDIVNGSGTIRTDGPVSLNSEVEVRVSRIPVQLSSDRLEFGPANWAADYGRHMGTGSATGIFRWVPSSSARLSFETNPIDVEKWNGIVVKASLLYEEGVLKIPDFVVVRGEGRLMGAATMSNPDKSVELRWNDVRLDPSGVKGVTGGQLHLQWQASDLSDVSGTGSVTLNAPELGRAAGNISVLNGRAQFGLDAIAQDAVIRADMRTGLDGRLSGTFRLTHRKFGSITADGTLRGTLTSPVATAVVAADAVTYKGIGPLDADAHASYENEVVLITDVNATLKNSRIPSGSLRMDFRSGTLEGALPAIIADMRDFVAEGSGRIDAAAHISGSLDEPIGSITASSSGLDIGGTHIDSLAAAADLENNVLTVHSLVATQQRGILEASGKANLQTKSVMAQANISALEITQIRGFTGTVNLDATITGTYLEPTAEVTGDVIGVNYQGQDHGTIQFSGMVNPDVVRGAVRSPKYKASLEGSVELAQPHRFTANVNTSQSAFQYRQYDFATSGQALAEGALNPLAVDRLQLENFSLSGVGVTLMAEGSLVEGIHTDAVADLTQIPYPDLQLGGQAQVRAVVRGSIDAPLVDGTLQTMNATLRHPGMAEAANIRAVVAFAQDRFDIRELRADYADARIVVSGSGGLKGSGEFEFKAENIRPERLLPDRPIAGVVGLEGSLTVHAPRLDAIEGRAKVTQLDLTAGGIAIHQTAEAEVVLAKQVLSIRNVSLNGPETEAFLEGTIALDTGRLDLESKAATDLRILEGFIPRSNASGQIESQVAIRGTFQQPDMIGFANLREAQIRVSDPSIFISGLMGSVRFSGNRFQVERATADLNGGTLDVSGGAGISSGGLTDAAVQATIKNMQLELPEGLQSQISADLALNGSAPNLTLTGNVDVLDALYRRDINLGEEVFERLTPDEKSGESLQKPQSLQEINLDVTVSTSGPVAVSNNVAKIDLIGDFRVRGTFADPVVLGRASALEGGEIYLGPSKGGEAAALGERRDRYIVERGTVDFNNLLHTEPSIDFEATHELEVKNERYLIRLRASGTPTNLRTELTSDPYLSEPDIIAMLLTGRSFADLQSARLTVAREQLLGYLSGQLTSGFFENVGASLGLDTVTIEPVTIASEQDVSARLTIGKDITSDLSLIYSQNLAGPRDQAWILNYSTFKDFVLRGINRTDQDQLQFELRHGLDFGGGPDLPRRIAPRDEARLGKITFQGATLPTEQLLKLVGKIGDPYNIYRMNEDVRSVKTFFAESGYLSCRVTARRNVVNGMAEVTFLVDQGPKIRLEFRGARVSSGVRKEIVDSWTSGFSEAASLLGSVDLLLRRLRDQGFLRANISTHHESQNQDHVYIFQIEPGSKYPRPKWIFHGIEPLDMTQSAGAVLEDPEAIKQEIEFRLRGQGFLDATVTVPDLVLEDDPPHFDVTVMKGVQYMVSAQHYSGNTFFTNARLSRVILHGPTEVITPEEAGATRPPEEEEPLKPFPYTSDWVSIAKSRLLTEYWQQGFNDVQIRASTDYDAGSGRIEINFDIREGERQQIAAIQVHGDSKTALSHIRRYFTFKLEDPVDFSRINLTRKKLYDTGLFKRVDIEVSKGANGYVANVNLNERAPWSVLYGITATDHQEKGARDVGFSGEVTHRNILGKGITAGISLRADQSLREGRFFSSLPVFMGKDISSTATLFRTRETLADSISNTWGFTIQQQRRLNDFYLLSYDYSFRRVATAERDLTTDDPDVVDGVVPVARFNATLSRDTRDDVLNATRGTFFSNSFQVAPPAVGSAVRFVRNYAQYMSFKELWPRLTWASAYRLGLARNFGDQPLVPSDRFNAGASLRSFGESSDAFTPGNALFVTNQELRYPLFWRIGVVGFFDIGNVYRRIGSARPLDQRYSPGIGLRLDTPFSLIRVDFGFNPWSKTGEGRRHISFGIGQAF